MDELNGNIKLAQHQKMDQISSHEIPITPTKSQNSLKNSSEFPKLQKDDSLQKFKLDESFQKQLEMNAFQKMLNEPVKETLMRDLRMIGYKLSYVILPRMREEQGKLLRNWDLWGPLLMCLMMASILSFSSSKKSENIFGTLFLIIWIGSFVVTVNARLLKSQLNFLQSICVLGYCLFPLNLACIFLTISIPFFIKFIIVFVGYIWSCLGSIAFMQSVIREDRKFMAVYPICLYFMFLAWYVLLIQ